MQQLNSSSRGVRGRNRPHYDAVSWNDTLAGPSCGSQASGKHLFPHLRSVLSHRRDDLPIEEEGSTIRHHDGKRARNRGTTGPPPATTQLALSFTFSWGRLSFLANKTTPPFASTYPGKLFMSFPRMLKFVVT